MAAAIERESDLTSEFVGGRGGVFEVRLDGELVFTNQGRGCGVPGDDEVVEAVKGALG